MRLRFGSDINSSKYRTSYYVAAKENSLQLHCNENRYADTTISYKNNYATESFAYLS